MGNFAGSTRRVAQAPRGDRQESERGTVGSNRRSYPWTRTRAVPPGGFGLRESFTQFFVKNLKPELEDRIQFVVGLGEPNLVASGLNFLTGDTVREERVGGGGHRIEKNTVQ